MVREYHAPLTAEQIVERADRRDRIRKSRIYVAAWCAVSLLILAGFVFLFYEPVHAWLHRHVELFLGILIGSLLQTIGWARDRWRWMRGFSWQ